MLVVKNLPANAEGCKRHGFDPLVRKIPWRRAWQPTPVLLAGESHAQRILAAIVQGSQSHTRLKRLSISSVQPLSRVWLFATPWIAACQASLSITNSRSSLKLTSIESVMPFSHLILCRPFSSCPQSLQASESFPMSHLFAWGGQSTGVSALASFLPKNTHARMQTYK